MGRFGEQTLEIGSGNVESEVGGMLEGFVHC
jgi:hypothetical protein